jgi:Icc-related predicted phosphoesterase
MHSPGNLFLQIRGRPLAAQGGLTMKCLLVADLHYALKQYDWLLRAAPEFDVVIIAGDLLDLSSHVPRPAQIVVVLKYLQRLAGLTRLVTCSGNHDLDALTADGEKTARWFSEIRNLGISADGDSFSLGDTLFTICPWWDGPATKAAVAEQLARDAAKEKRRWVWVYHAPPAGSPTSWDGKRSYGDQELTKWISAYSPDLVFCGHVHYAPLSPGGSWIDRIGTTTVFNAGYQLGPVPAYVVIDTDEEAILWFSATSLQAAPLAGLEPHKVEKISEVPAWFTAADRILSQVPQ